jgi:hypothetical protein
MEVRGEYIVSVKKDGKYSVKKRKLTKKEFDTWYDELVESGYKIIGIF